MATKKKTKTVDAKSALLAKIESSEKVRAKHADKPANDAKRRLATKRLKRSQRRLARVVKNEKRAAEAKKKPE